MSSKEGRLDSDGLAVLSGQPEVLERVGAEVVAAESQVLDILYARLDVPGL